MDKKALVVPIPLGPKLEVNGSPNDQAHLFFTFLEINESPVLVELLPGDSVP